MEDLIGLIPAAGRANRLAPLSCSKEIFPLGMMKSKTGKSVKYHPKPVGLYLIERMMIAGVKRTYIILSREKWDIAHYFGNGSSFGLPIAYLIQENLIGMPDALNIAYPWVRSATILFGMPDTIFHPSEAFKIILDNHQKTNADLTLGLFPTEKPKKFGMVSFDHENNFTYTIDKPSQTDLKFMWGIGCWEPSFTQLLNNRLSKINEYQEEIVLGDIFQDAVESGLSVKVIPFQKGEFIDIGSLDDLADMIQHFSGSE